MSPKIERPKPIDQEISFAIEELFFSTTDEVGTILSGNDTFVRISQYSRQELIGQPHNIIRHPDMPRIVFKVLWDYIQSGRPVAAYVKNLAKDGRYYWVLATVFPIPEGYLSIRLKPTTEIFQLMPGIYANLLEAEKKGGMEESLKVLLEILRSKGFENYDVFFLTALIEELKARDKALKRYYDEELDGVGDQYKTDSLTRTLTDIQTKSRKIGALFNSLFSDVNHFLELDSMLGANSKFIMDLSQQIFHLAMNANVESFRAGTMGASLAVLAKEIQLRSDDMKRNADAILAKARELSKDSNKQILEIGFQIIAPKLQNEMILSFVREVFSNSRKSEVSQDKLQEIRANGLSLIHLLTTYSHKMMEQLYPLRDQLVQLTHFVESIETTMRELEMTQIAGTIESARIGEMGKTFMVVFEEMSKLNAEARKRLEDFQESLKIVRERVDKMLVAETHIKTLLRSVEPLMKGIAETDVARV